MTGSPVSMYVMPCPCGIVWYTTRADAGGTCGEVEKGERSGFRSGAVIDGPKGCGRELPAPVPEADSRRSE